MTPENTAIIYSNESASYLTLKDESSLKEAKKAAEESIKVMPNWWKGYYRRGRAEMGFEDWKNAQKSFEKALALNPQSKESRDELSTVRAKVSS